MREQSSAVRKKTGFKSIESGATEGEEEESDLDVSAFRMYMWEQINLVYALSEIDLSKQACSDLNNSCDFQYKFL